MKIRKTTDVFLLNASSFSFWKIVFIYISAVEIMAFIITYTLLDESLLIDAHSKNLAYKRAVEVANLQMTLQWAVYLLIPISLIFQIIATASIVSGGFYMFEYDFTFSAVARSVVITEFINLIPMLLKWIWFGFIYRSYSLEDLHIFSPLSVSSLFPSITLLPTYLLSAMQSLNVFSGMYVFLLAYLLSLLLDRPFKETLKVVLLSYGSAWLIWQVFTIFLLINLS